MKVVNQNEWRKRVITQYLDLIILEKLANSRTWGYVIFNHVKKEFGVRLYAADLYPRLRSMQKDGLIKSEETSEKRRKQYEITPDGLSFLRYGIKVLNEFINET